MSHLKALIFDVDGTLAETERDGHRIAFNRAFSNAGLDWHWDEDLYADLLTVTGGKERIRYYLEKYKSESFTPEQQALISSLHKVKTQYYSEILHANLIPLRPGVARLIEAARQSDLKLAIATTTTVENVEALLISTLGEQSLSWFSIIAAGDVVPAKKPAPDIYDYCLEGLNLPASECIAIEDSANGLKASLGAHIQTLVTVNDYTYNEDFTGAVSVISHLGDRDNPCQSIAGVTIPLNLVDIDVLRTLHAHPNS